MTLERPPSDLALEEASAWHARLKAPTVSSKTLEAFQTWRADPDHRAAYAKVEDAWRAASALGGDPDVERLLAAIPRRSRAKALGASLALAACLLAAVAIALIIRPQTYATKVGEQRVAALVDGSSVRLDTASKVEVRYTAGERRVELVSGTALFEVAKDTSRPFVVEAGGATVRALGTRFEVRRDGGPVSVTLLKGSVEVRPATGEILWRLRPGEQLTLRGPAPAPQMVDTAAATSWTSGRIVLRATPLDEAVREVNRYSRRKLVVASADASPLLVSGSFATGDVDAFAAAVSDLYGLRALAQADGSIVLTP